MDSKLSLASNQEEKINGKIDKEALINREIELVADELGMEFKMHKKSIDDNTLGALTSVADLLIINKEELSKYENQVVLTDIVKLVACPVLIIPDNPQFENLLMVHDGSRSSVQAVKHFITIFNQDLRTLPVSVLTSDPKSNRDIESEKVFIDYVKLFFNDIGIQLMTDEPLNCMVRNIEYASNNSMIVVGEETGIDILNCTTKNKALLDELPIFIFKNASI